MIQNKEKSNKGFIAAWIIVQVCLFFIPLLFVPIIASYNMSRDTHMVNTINQRAFASQQGELSSAVVTYFDAQEVYEQKVWMLNNKELYYVLPLVAMLMLSIILQLFNFWWYDIYEQIKEEQMFDGFY